jgi:quercetin dioxygenase-like cupin family protein
MATNQMKNTAIAFLLAVLVAFFNVSPVLAASKQNITVFHTDQQKSFAVGEDIFTFKSFTDPESSDTEANFSVVEITNAPHRYPGGFLLERHVVNAPEEFYVLDGEFEFLNPSGKATSVDAGDRVYIPGGVPYGYKNVGSESAHILLITPSQNLEKFIAQVGKPIAIGTNILTNAAPPDMGKITSVAPRYGIEFLN